jgi:hypothetical protein
MDLKFEFKKIRSSASIVRVSVDENGNIQSISSNDLQLEKRLLAEADSSDFKKFVKCIFSGSICSDQIDVFHNGKTVSYKVEQFA